ncbi:hypothetical protein [Streptomyces sp. NPDC056600]|uniref:hypothetical protein n=1 Tax=Streptomyces sp. NPDC056600 TaxID=3345874 RepID=UPI0036743A69
MTAVTRKGKHTGQVLEIFQVEVREEDREALTADPAGFLRSRLEPEYKVNGICVDARNLGSPEVVAAGFVQLVHVSGGPFDSYYFWPPHKE